MILTIPHRPSTSTARAPEHSHSVRALHRGHPFGRFFCQELIGALLTLPGLDQHLAHGTICTMMPGEEPAFGLAQSDGPMRFAVR
jgi:hypothetical protein